MTSIQIECFLAAARTGSFSAAAKELFLSAQAVSQHIQSLEKELSAPLFFRKSSGVSLTPDGCDFLSFASRWNGMFHATMDTIRKRYRNMALRFRVGISEYIDPLGPISGGLSAFAAEHEDVTFLGRQYSSREIMKAVSDGELDAALLADSQIVYGGDYDIFPFAQEDLRLFVANVPELPDDFTLADVSALPENIPHLDASYGPWTPEEWGEISRRMSHHLGVERPKHYTFASFRSVVASVRSTRCTAVSDVRFGYLQESESLRSIPLGDSYSLCCVSNRRNENPLIPEFQTFLKEYFIR